MTIIVESVTPLGLTSQETTGAGSYVAIGVSYEVLAERIEFWADDDIGMFYVYFPVPSTIAVYTSIRILDSDTNVVEQVIIPYSTTTNRFSFQVDIESLGFGDYTVEIDTVSAQAEGGVNLSGNANLSASNYYYNPDGLNPTLSGIADISATVFHCTFEGGVTLEGSADIAFSYYTYIAEGGLNLGEEATETMSAFDAASGGLTLAGAAPAVARYTVTPTVSNVESKFSCLAAGNWWCGEFDACIEQGSESIIFQGALIPAITICNSSKQVIKVTNRNVVNT